MPPVRVWLLAALAAALPLLAASSEVSRTPPDVYAQKIAAQLTPLSEVLEGRTAFPDDKSGAIVLLSERIDYRTDEGMACRAYHLVYHAVNQSAVETVGTDVFSYDRLREEIFLVDAATITLDGRRQPVEGSGVFIQTPQHEAERSLYTSQAELRIIYPNVTPGATTEVIVFVREHTPVMAGEFATSVTFGRTWPVYRMRRLIDFPADFMAQVRVFASSAGVPQPLSENYAPGRERRIWERAAVSPVAWEENGPRWEFRGPTLWLTTLDSWDEVTAWYHSLVADRSGLGTELAAHVDAWTAGLGERREIIDKLTDVVANEVRYAGLEFGLAGYQPHACREVWEKRYGDCKDKANLLRAMLAHKGIMAHLVLLETRGMGRIERACPSWQQFNHVILAVENEAGDGYLFCDPTIEHLPAGSIGLSDQAREVLLIKNGQAEWEQTPDALDSAVRIEAELAVGTDGGLSGWLTLATEGADAAIYAGFYNRKDPDERQRSLQQYVERFFPGGQVIDVDYTPPAGAVRAAKIRAYMVRAPRGSAEQSLTFPYPKHWLPDVDTAGERRFPYETSRRIESTTVTFLLPPNWQARTLPSAFAAPSDVGQFDATWSLRGTQLEARLAWFPKRAVLAPSEYGVFQSSVRALASWLEQPAILVPTSTRVATTDDKTQSSGEALLEFPILPSGAGQLRLLEQKFPAEQHGTLRRAALERVLQWFPDDNETIFEAQAKLALLDWDHDRITDAEFVERVGSLLARFGTLVSAEDRTWGEYLEAKARWRLSKDPAAITQLQRIADDTSLSEYRRGWSAESAGRFLGQSDPAAAIAFLRRHDDYDSEARETIVRLVVQLHLRTQDYDGLESWASELLGDHSEAADMLLSLALTEIANGIENISATQRSALCAKWEALVPDATAFPRAHPELVKLKDLLIVDTAIRQFRDTLRSWLEAHPPVWWTREMDPTYADADAVVARIKDRNDARDPESLLNAWLQLSLHHEPEFDAFALYTRWALWWLNKRRIADDLFDVIGKATLQLPPAVDEEVIECWNLYTTWLVDVGRLDEARALFARAYDSPAAKPYQRVDAAGGLGLLELKAGNADAALASLQRIESIHLSHKHSANFLYPAILLHLERNDYDRALEVIALIREEKPENVRDSEHGVVLPHLLRAAENAAQIKVYWAHRKSWRETWDMMLASHQCPRTSAPPFVLETDSTAITQRVDKAVAAKDLSEYLRALDALALTAQWVPIYASELMRQVARSEPFGTLVQRGLYEIGLLIVGQLEPVDPQFDHSGLFWEVALLSDLGRTKAAAAAARKLATAAGVGSRLGQTSLRLWVANSHKEPDAAEAVQNLADALASPTAFYDRLDAVETLLAAYAAQGDLGAQRALLEREVNRSGFDASSAAGRRLQTRYTQLHTQVAAATKLTSAIHAWREKHQLGWLDQVPPHAADEPRYAQLKAPLYQTPQGFTEAETLKFNLLTSLDEGHNTDLRGEALYALAWEIAFAADDIREFAAVLKGIAAIESVPANLRATCVIVAMNVLLRNGHDTLAAELAADPLASIVRSEIRADYTRAYNAMQRIDSAGDRWETDAVAMLSGQPLERFSITAIDRIVRRLALAGEYDRAKAIIGAAKDLPIDPGFQQSMPTLRLEWTRTVQALRDQSPLVTGVRGALTALPESQRAPSDKVRFHFGFEDRSRLTDQERVALAYQTLTTGQGLPESWGPMLETLVGARLFAKEQRMWFPEVLEQGLQIDAPDAALAQFVVTVSRGGDIDHRDIRERVTKLLADFRTSSRAPDHPQTVLAVTTIEAYIALRTSRETKPDALFDFNRLSGLPPGIGKSLQLKFHASRGQHAEALRLIEKFSADELTEPENFIPARAELLGAGRAAEVELLDESIRTVLARRVPDFWRDPQRIGFGGWFEVIDALRATDVLPDAWFGHAQAVSSLPLRHSGLRLAQAWLKRDWVGVQDAANASLAILADTFDTYYMRAVARHELGDDDGARADLRIFLKHCLDSEHYPAALKLFRELAPEEKFDSDS